ncbi:hypothetical protein S7711_03439, partial [Stachybotrys chartarum IBT 7711]
REIRLVSVLPGRWSEDVSCKLTVVSLDAKPSYEALSYTWGDLLNKVIIRLEGSDMLERPGIYGWMLYASISQSRLCLGFIHTAFQIICHTKSLEVLATVEKKRTDSEIPTWCPDRRSSSNGEENDPWVHSRSLRFDAGLSSGNVAELCHTRILTVKGVYADVVARMALPLSQDEELAPRLDEFARMVGYDSAPQAPYIRGGIMKEAFWRTMLNEALELKPNRHEQLMVQDETFFAWWWKIMKDGNAQVPNSAVLSSLEPVNLEYTITGPQVFHRHFQARLRITARSFWLPNDNRTFFTTQQGYMGFGPPDMRHGDSVAILLGSRMPFILRQVPLPAMVDENDEIHDETYYSVVGYCYLRRVMDGEAVGENAKICDIHLI